MCCGCGTSYIESVHIQCRSSIYTLLLCRGHLWRVRLAKQETLTPPGHLVSPLVLVGWWRWFNERAVKLRTLPLVPSPTGPHPARGDGGCVHVYPCLPCMVRIFNGFYSATSLVSVSAVTHWQPSPLNSIWTWSEDGIKFNPDGGSNPGRQIDSQAL